MEQIAAWVKEVENTSIEFPLGGDVPVPADQIRLQHIVGVLVTLEKTAREMGFDVTLTIYGHADSTGSEKRNYEISQARTRTVAALLYARGSSMPIAMYGMGSEYPKGEESLDEGGPPREDQASRRIELRVRLARSVTDPDALLQ
jgi:outer membrane protein OmpA-like peptidoglycan-associated protein